MIAARRLLQASYLSFQRTFHSTPAVFKQSNTLYGWEEESPYQQEDTTPITSAIVKALAHSDIPLTTSELWDKLQNQNSRFESKRRMKIALKQLRSHGYISAVPNRGMKRGDLRDSYVITLTHKVKLPPGVVAVRAKDIAPSRRRPVRLGSEEAVS
ncbi:hypothetical protein BSKO_08111 [Bryopsis sp. KO-2023]|nr:hypothetical protein BSKO_08111 [Bryopsis sp. KO-2023]